MLKEHWEESKFLKGLLVFLILSLRLHFIVFHISVSSDTELSPRVADIKTDAYKAVYSGLSTMQTLLQTVKWEVTTH